MVCGLLKLGSTAQLLTGGLPSFHVVRVRQQIPIRIRVQDSALFQEGCVARSDGSSSTECGESTTAKDAANLRADAGGVNITEIRPCQGMV